MRYNILRYLSVRFLLAALCAFPGGAQEPLWRGALPGSASASPVYDGEAVTVLCDGGNLVSYGPDGGRLWTWSAGGRLVRFMGHSPEGMFYVCRTNGIFFALNKSGRELWRRTLDSPLAAPVLSGADGRIFLVTQGAVTCYTVSGTRLWSRRLEAPLSFPPIMTPAGNFLAGLQDGTLLELGPFGQARKRAYEKPLASAAWGEGSPVLFFESGEAEAVPGPGAEGPVWSFGNLGGRAICAAACEGGIAVLLSTGECALLSSGAGGAKVAWKSRILPPLPSPSPLNPEAALYSDVRGITVAGKTRVIQLDGAGQERRAFTLPQAAPVPPALSASGTLHAGSGDWVLYAWRFCEAREENTPPPSDLYGLSDPRRENLGDYPWGFEDYEIDSALERIRAECGAGSTGANEAVRTGYLMEIASDLGRAARTVPRGRQGEMRRIVSLPRRTAALELLGQIGGREAIRFLAELFTDDPEPLIKSAAAAAAGKTGADFGGRALRAFEDLVNGPGAVRDEQVLLAVIGAAGNIGFYAGSPANRLSARLLASFDSPSRPQTLRRRARQELARLRR